MCSVVCGNARDNRNCEYNTMIDVWSLDTLWPASNDVVCSYCALQLEPFVKNNPEYQRFVDFERKGIQWMTAAPQCYSPPLLCLFLCSVVMACWMDKVDMQADRGPWWLFASGFSSLPSFFFLHDRLPCGLYCPMFKVQSLPLCKFANCKRSSKGLYYLVLLEQAWP